jgi:hypothetical protein
MGIRATIMRPSKRKLRRFKPQVPEVGGSIPLPHTSYYKGLEDISPASNSFFHGFSNGFLTEFGKGVRGIPKMSWPMFDRTDGGLIESRLHQRVKKSWIQNERFPIKMKHNPAGQRGKKASETLIGWMLKRFSTSGVQ